MLCSSSHLDLYLLTSIPTTVSSTLCPLHTPRLFHCWILVTFYTCLSLSLFLWNFLSAQLHSHTVVTLPKTQTRVPHPQANLQLPDLSFLEKLHWNTLLTQFTQHKPHETAFKKLNFLPSQRYIAAGNGGLTSVGASHRQDQAVHFPFTSTMRAAMAVKREQSERASRHSGAVAQTPALSCCLSPSLSWWLPVWHSPSNTALH